MVGGAVLVPPKDKLPSLHPVTAQAFEFNRPAVVGFGLNPVPANASAGFDPTLVCMELEKSMVADGEPLVSESCALMLMADITNTTAARNLPEREAAARCVKRVKFNMVFLVGFSRQRWREVGGAMLVLYYQNEFKLFTLHPHEYEHTPIWRAGMKKAGTAQCLMAAIPGSSIPSSDSSIAPPPVDT